MQQQNTTQITLVGGPMDGYPLPNAPYRRGHNLFLASPDRTKWHHYKVSEAGVFVHCCSSGFNTRCECQTTSTHRLIGFLVLAAVCAAIYFTLRWAN